MGKSYETISPEQRKWMDRQKIFFVATAPVARDGHVNCSPKGGDTFRVLGNTEVAYLDLTGSGIETAAHVQENGRIVIMFCAFTGAPQILRLHGRAEVIYPSDPRFAVLILNFPEHPGARLIIRVDVTRVSDSCGYAVPLFDFVESRDVLDQWTEKKGPDGLVAYRKAKNRTSIDGLPAYRDLPTDE